MRKFVHSGEFVLILYIGISETNFLNGANYSLGAHCSKHIVSKNKLPKSKKNVTPSNASIFVIMDFIWGKSMNKIVVDDNHMNYVIKPIFMSGN